MVRFKQRYIVCEVMPEKESKLPLPVTDIRGFVNVIKAHIQDLYGDYGTAQCSPNLSIKYLNPMTRTLLIKSARGTHNMVMHALTMVKKIADTDLMIRTLHVAGSIRLCQKFLVKHNKQQLQLLLRRCKTTEEKEKVKRSLSQTGIPDEDEPLSTA